MMQNACVYLMPELKNEIHILLRAVNYVGFVCEKRTNLYD